MNKEGNQHEKDKTHISDNWVKMFEKSGTEEEMKMSGQKNASYMPCCEL